MLYIGIEALAEGEGVRNKTKVQFQIVKPLISLCLGVFVVPSR